MRPRAIEEAGASQEARDDAVYGREPGGEDRRIGYADVPDADAIEADTEHAETVAESQLRAKEAEVKAQREANQNR